MPTGSELLADLNTPDDDLRPLAVDLLYRDTITMLAADAGVGKSTVATNIAVSLALGQPIFGKFDVPAPCRVFYLQLEGSYRESKKRLRLIRESQQVAADLPWCTPNLIWEAWDSPLNVLKPDSADTLLDYISGLCASNGPPDLIVIDPIYMCMGGDLSKMEVAQAFVRFSNRLRTTFGSAILHLHHNRKPTRNPEGKLMEDDDAFFGSTFLKAHVDVSYAMRKKLAAGGEEDRIILQCRKDRNNNVASTIVLDYDHEFYTLRVLNDSVLLKTTEMIIATLLKFKKSGKFITTFNEVLSDSHVSVPSLYRFRSDSLAENYVTFDKISGNKTMWRLK